MAETSHRFIDPDSTGTSKEDIAKDKGTFFICYGRGLVFVINCLMMERTGFVTVCYTPGKLMLVGGMCFVLRSLLLLCSSDMIFFLVAGNILKRVNI